MKRTVIAMLLCLIAGSAMGATIADIQMGVYPNNTVVDLSGVTVTGVRYNGFFCAEAPFGAWNGIWVYTGADTGVLPGDIVDVTAGLYYEYYDLSEVEATATVGATVTIVSTGGALPAPSTVQAADLAADGEPWESCLIIIPNGMQVTVAPSSYGEWYAFAFDGATVMFDDYWYDDTTVGVGDCYNNATGILMYNFGAFKLEVLADGVDVADCAIDNETSSFGSVKGLFR